MPTGQQDPATDTVAGFVDAVSDAGNDDRVSLDDLMGRFGRRAFGPMLLVVGLLAVAPTGAIPGMSIVCGTLVILIAAQMSLALQRPWLPRRLLAFSFRRSLLDKTVETLAPYARRLDRVVRPRLSPLVEPPLSRAVGFVLIGLAALMYPLALLPFAVALPGTTIILLAIGITFGDGLFVVLGLVLAATAPVPLLFL